MTAYERLLKKLPKKYHERVSNFEEEDGLIDDCKYMLYFAEGWYLDYEDEQGGCFPVFSIDEAIKFIKQLDYTDKRY